MRKHIREHFKPTLRTFIDRLHVEATHAIRYPRRSRVELINDLELRFFGLQRSGNHAIINWILLNLPGMICFLNNVRVTHHHNPYLSFGQALLKDGDCILNYQPHLPDKYRLVREWHLQHPHKDALLYSYENRPLEAVPGDALRREHDRCLGRSLGTMDVLILRDPFNCFASMLKRNTVFGRKGLSARFVDKWKSYAREFLGETHYLEPDRITINYNTWCADGQYRRSIADRLGLAGTGPGINEVPRIGGGSSFDGVAFQGSAVSMRTDQRWREFEDREDYRQIFADEEIVELSRHIFGRIPGTESLLQDKPE